MKNKTILYWILAGLIYLAVVIGGYFVYEAVAGPIVHETHADIDHGASHGADHGLHKPGKLAEVVEVDGQKVIYLEAKEAYWLFNDEALGDLWTFDGVYPGPEIRVQEGDHVVIRLMNSLTVPTALHLHGVPVPNEMDGVPGVTQNAIMPGEEFVYEFIADTPGTYWYHSHQQGAVQVERGLFGALIIEPHDQPEYALDQVIMLSEWSSMFDGSQAMGHAAHGGHGVHGGHGGNGEHGDQSEADHVDHGSEPHHSDYGNDGHDEDGSQAGHDDHAAHGGHGDHGHDAGHVEAGLSHADMMNEMYDMLLINGKAKPQIQPIVVHEGDKVKLRFINSGLFTQVISIPGHAFRVTHYDGQPVNEPELLRDVALRIAPAERYDIELVTDQPNAWGIQVYAEKNKEKLNIWIPLLYAGYEDMELEKGEALSDFFDITTYGSKKDIPIGEITKDFKMVLGTNDHGETFTINNRQMPNHEVFEVNEGDHVRVTITNETKADHPMHLHGHFFRVLSRNGVEVSGSPIIKDTLNVRPHESYEIYFIADNPGHWMFHCHELHHAAGGMVAELRYTGYEPKFTLDPKIPNIPE